MQIQPDWYVEVQKYSKANDLSVAQLIRRAVNYWIKKNK